MRTVLVALLLAACTGDTGPAGPQGPQGNAGSNGSDGQSAPTTGTLTGTVTDGVMHDALANVAVTAMDAGGATLASATTAADGTFSVTVAAGPVDLAFAKDLYTSPGVLHAGVGLGQTVHLSVAMNEAASGKPSLSLAVAGDDFGFGAQVPITATAADPNGDTLTYTWSNTTAPLVGAVGGDGTVTMPTMAQAFAFRPDPSNPGAFISGYTLEDRFGIIPISTDTRGQMTAKLTVSDGRGQSTSASITLDAASTADSVKNVPIGQRIYLNSGHDAANAWTLTVPAGSTAVLDDPTLRTPSFVPDVKGTYVLAEGANTMTIYSGRYRGAIAGGSGNSIQVDSECLLCHQGTFTDAPPDIFTPWLGTAHAQTFVNAVNGNFGPFFGTACLGCHTTGNDLGVANNGFDDAAKAAGWTFPGTPSATNWTTMVNTAPTVAALASVQCESCHGPQTSDGHIKTYDANNKPQPFSSPRISYAAEVCAKCHAAGLTHTYSEWATKAADGQSHSNRADTSLAAGATGLNSSCGRCHAAQGYSLYSDLLKQGKVALNSVPAATLAQVTAANVEPVTCVACHDPHDASNPDQLRFYGDTPNLPGGFAGHGMGKGALCLTCHNSRNGAQTGSDALTYLHEDGETYNSGNPTGYSAPHQAAQGDVFTGHNAYFMGANMPMTSKHAAIEDTCVGCHMTLNPNTFNGHGGPTVADHMFRIDDSNQAALCSKCHGNTVNGEGIQGQVETQLAALGTKLSTAIKTKVNAFPGGLVRVRAWDAATDYYSSTSASNLVLDVVANPVTSVSIEEIHGQIGFVLNFATPITVPFVTGSGAPAPSKAMTSFGVQLGAFKDNSATPVVLYALSGNFVRAGWNYFLVEGDQSKGLHNPSFVTAVLNNSLAKDVTN